MVAVHVLFTGIMVEYRLAASKMSITLSGRLEPRPAVPFPEQRLAFVLRAGERRGRRELFRALTLGCLGSSIS